jgi:hypothetical protein
MGSPGVLGVILAAVSGDMPSLLGSLIKVAGVTGLLGSDGCDISRAGDFSAAVGTGGGLIKISESGSGETESSLLATLLPRTGGCKERLFERGIKPLTLSVGKFPKEAPLRLVIGFEAGDCLTLLAGVLADMLPFLRPLRGGPDIGRVAVSVFISTGEAVVPVPCPPWASKAGDVSGLKKSSAFPYSGK